MKIFTDVQIGAASHTGRVRRSNEDDYLLWMPAERERGRLMVLADGMGGVTGGAEASRAAVRAVAATFLEPGGDRPEAAKARMGDAFANACRTVFGRSRENPGLRSMGTTLTALYLRGDRALLGHVGDSRCYRWRDGRLEQLTTDHAVRNENRLTRCVGGGRDTEEIDLLESEARVDDRWLLVSDGVWESVRADEVAHLLERRAPQEAAEALVRLSHARGGTDNATAVVLQVVGDPTAPAERRETEMSADEPTMTSDLERRQVSLRRPRWPWAVLALSVVLGGLAVARWVFGFDLLGRG
ncbi:MAG: PP2C family serine/threonine-protein phosphatase [Planctomycetota bacterium]